MNDSKRKKNIIVLFDYDGTIIDSVDLAYKIFKSISKEYGLASPKSVKHFVQFYKINFYESLLVNGLLHSKIPYFAREFRLPFIEHEKEMQVFKGMKGIIEKLSKKAKIIIITSNFSDVVKSSIKAHRLKGISKVIGADSGFSKFKTIKMIKKKYPNYKIFYIGDTCGDMIEAKKAGVKRIGVTWGYHTRKELEEAKPDFIVNKSKELLEILRN